MTHRAFVAGIAAMIMAASAVLWAFTPPLPLRTTFYLLNVFLAVRYTLRMLKS